MGLPRGCMPIKGSASTLRDVWARGGAAWEARGHWQASGHHCTGRGDAKRAGRCYEPNGVPHCALADVPRAALCGGMVWCGVPCACGGGGGGMSILHPPHMDHSSGCRALRNGPARCASGKPQAMRTVSSTADEQPATSAPGTMQIVGIWSGQGCGAVVHHGAHDQILHKNGYTPTNVQGGRGHS